MSTDTEINQSLLVEAIETLERVGCQFDFCDGPTLDPVPMGTCYLCETLAKLRVAVGQHPRHPDEMTASERVDDRLRRYMATTVPR